MASIWILNGPDQRVASSDEVALGDHVVRPERDALHVGVVMDSGGSRGLKWLGEVPRSALPIDALRDLAGIGELRRSSSEGLVRAARGLESALRTRGG